MSCISLNTKVTHLRLTRCSRRAVFSSQPLQLFAGVLGPIPDGSRCRLIVNKETGVSAVCWEDKKAASRGAIHKGLEVTVGGLCGWHKCSSAGAHTVPALLSGLPFPLAMAFPLPMGNSKIFSTYRTVHSTFHCVQSANHHERETSDKMCNVTGWWAKKGGALGTGFVPPGGPGLPLSKQSPGRGGGWES